MAMPVRERIVREHHPVERRMVKTTSKVSAAEMRAHLRVVPRRRRTARTVALLAALVFTMMAGAAAFQIQIARRQLQLDQLERQIAEASNEYDALRLERAELRAPGRLLAEATALGMVPGSESQFMVVSPEAVAAVQQSAGTLTAAQSSVGLTDIERLSQVKQALAEAP